MVICHRPARGNPEQCPRMPALTPEALTRTVQDFLSEAASAIVLENGAVAFDLAQSRYSISGYIHQRLNTWRNPGIQSLVNITAVCCISGRMSETPFAVSWKLK